MKNKPFVVEWLENAQYNLERAKARATGPAVIQIEVAMEQIASSLRVLEEGD